MSSISITINFPTWAYYAIVGILIVSGGFRLWLLIETRRLRKAIGK